MFVWLAALLCRNLLMSQNCRGWERMFLFIFFCSYFVAELNIKKNSWFNLRLRHLYWFCQFLLPSCPYFIPLVEVCPFFRLSVLQAVCFLACVKRPCRGPGGKDISSDPCTPTHTLFTRCHDCGQKWKRKKEGECCMYIANGKLLIPADGEMLRA